MLDHVVAGSRPVESQILSPPHRLDMTEILLKMAKNNHSRNLNLGYLAKNWRTYNKFRCV